MARGAASAKGSSAPACLAVTPGDFRKWLRQAKPGAEFTYAVGYALDDQHSVVSLARDCRDKGAVKLWRSRRADGQYDYFARRVASAKPSPAPATKPRAVDLDGEAGQVLRLLDGCAAKAAPCPTNRAIALQMRPKVDPRRVRYLIDQLEDDGLIAVENRGPRITRVITINASGNRTSEARTPVGRGFHDEVRG